jgi:hypothetical protein
MTRTKVKIKIESTKITMTSTPSHFHSEPFNDDKVYQAFPSFDSNISTKQLIGLDTLQQSQTEEVVTTSNDTSTINSSTSAVTQSNNEADSVSFSKHAIFTENKEPEPSTSCDKNASDNCTIGADSMTPVVDTHDRNKRSKKIKCKVYRKVRLGSDEAPSTFIQKVRNIS